MSLEEEQHLEESYIMHTFGRKPVELVRGAGMKVWDDTGREYLDFIAGIGVNSLGHCHPALVNALAQQEQQLIHVGNYYYIEGRGRLAQRISDLINLNEEENAEDWQSFFANSGAEANECALKLARLYARKHASDPSAPCDKRIIVTLERSFHGRTLATLAATAQPVKQEVFQPLPDGFIATPANDCAALEKLFADKGNQICGILIEPIQGECGVFPCTQEFLQTARLLTERYHALLMFDEVQCGIYRCGTYPFGFQHFNVMPDVITIAKGIGGGMPMGVCAARTSVAQVFDPGEHGTTFGGSNLAVAAAQCVLSTIQEEGLDSQVTRVGAYLQERLRELDHVVEVRGIGLMVAAQFDESIDAPALVLAALDKGLLLNATDAHTLRFLPPLICNQSDVDELLIRLKELL